MPESAPGSAIKSSEPQIDTTTPVEQGVALPEQHTEQAVVEAKANEVQAAEANRLAEISRQFEAIGEAIGPIEKPTAPEVTAAAEPVAVGRPMEAEEAPQVGAKAGPEVQSESNQTKVTEEVAKQEMPKPVDTPVLEVTEEPEQKEVAKQPEAVESTDNQPGEKTLEDQVETQPTKSPEQLQAELAQEQQRIASLRQQIQQVEQVQQPENLAEKLAKEAEEMTQKLNASPAPSNTGPTVNAESTLLADFEKQRAMFLSSFQTAVKANELKKAA